MDFQNYYMGLKYLKNQARGVYSGKDEFSGARTVIMVSQRRFRTLEGSHVGSSPNRFGGTKFEFKGFQKSKGSGSQGGFWFHVRRRGFQL